MFRNCLLIVGLMIGLTACGASTTTGSVPSAPTVAMVTAVAAAPSVTAAAPTVAPSAPPSATLAPTSEAATAAPTTEATLAVATPQTTIETDDTHDTPLLEDAQAHTLPTESAAPAATATTSDPTRLSIDQIEVDRELVSVGLDKNRVPIVPKHDIAWYNLSAQPGQGENIVMWGHVLRFKSTPEIPAPFARLKELPIGARITVQTADGNTFNYIVSEKVYAQPDQVEYILPVGHERLTLVSCIGDKVVVDGSVEMTQRLITIALPEK